MTASQTVMFLNISRSLFLQHGFKKTDVTVIKKKIVADMSHMHISEILSSIPIGPLERKQLCTVYTKICWGILNN